MHRLHDEHISHLSGHCDNVRFINSHEENVRGSLYIRVHGLLHRHIVYNGFIAFRRYTYVLPYDIKTKFFCRLLNFDSQNVLFTLRTETLVILMSAEIMQIPFPMDKQHPAKSWMRITH